MKSNEMAYIDFMRRVYADSLAPNTFARWPFNYGGLVVPTLLYSLPLPSKNSSEDNYATLQINLLYDFMSAHQRTVYVPSFADTVNQTHQSLIKNTYFRFQTTENCRLFERLTFLPWKERITHQFEWYMWQRSEVTHFVRTVLDKTGESPLVLYTHGMGEKHINAVGLNCIHAVRKRY